MPFYTFRFPFLFSFFSPLFFLLFFSLLIRYEGCVPDQTRQTYYTAVSTMALIFHRIFLVYFFLYLLHFILRHTAYRTQLTRQWSIDSSIYFTEHT